jgi:biotin carboxyl carrier protein
MANANNQPILIAGDQGKALATTNYRVQVAGQTRTVAIIEREAGLSLKIGDGPEQAVEVLTRTADGGLSVLVGGVVLHGLVGQRGTHGLTEDAVTVVVGGQTLEAVVQDERAARLASAAAAGRPHSSVTAIRAPMPGLVVAVPVAVGEQVARGTTLVVLSAMKMQNELTAPADGTVTEVAVSAGQTVDQNQVLVRLE